MMKKILFIAFLPLLLASCASDTPMNIDGTGQGGSLARFGSFGDILYVVTDRQLQVYQIGADGQSQAIRNLPLDQGLETLFRRDSILFVGADDGMYLFDVTDPTFPRQYAKFLHITAWDPVVADEHRAYVTLRSFMNNRTRRRIGVDQLEVIDITNPRNPTLLRTKNMESPQGLAIHDSLLLVCDKGIKIFKVDSALTLPPLNQLNIDAHDVVVVADVAMVIGRTGLTQYRLKPDITFEFLSRITTKAP